jgi:hypothetical protein
MGALQVAVRRVGLFRLLIKWGWWKRLRILDLWTLSGDSVAMWHLHDAMKNIADRKDLNDSVGRAFSRELWRRARSLGIEPKAT